MTIGGEVYDPLQQLSILKGHTNIEARKRGTSKLVNYGNANTKKKLGRAMAKASSP